jgi:hypothetical protein
LSPDRPRDGGAFGQRLAMLVGKIGLVHRLRKISAQRIVCASEERLGRVLTKSRSR